MTTKFMKIYEAEKGYKLD